MNAMDRRTFAVSLAGGALGVAAAGQAASQPAAGRSSFDAGAVVTSAAEIVRREYVDASAANTLADFLLSNLRAGRYGGASSPRALAEQLTEELRARTNDLHMSVSYDPDKPDKEAPDEIAEDDLDSRFIDAGLQTVARLPGNIGLMRLTHFDSQKDRGAARYGAALEIVKDTLALVLDLTVNHGGDTDTVAYFLSYFTGGEIEIDHLVSRHLPPQILRTEKSVAGPRYGGSRPVFVAISHATFSGGEMVASRLKLLRGATLIGRTTKGGAHLGQFFKLPYGLKIFVVTGRSMRREWETVGVAADIPTEPEFAVAVAHRLALDAVMRRTTDKKTLQILRNVANHSTENLSSFSL
jgi:hypothetical protein